MLLAGVEPADPGRDRSEQQRIGQCQFALSNDTVYIIVIWAFSCITRRHREMIYSIVLIYSFVRR